MLNAVCTPNSDRITMLRKPAFGAAIATQASAVIRLEIMSGTTISTASWRRPGASVRARIQASAPPTRIDSTATVAQSETVLTNASRYRSPP